MGRIITAPGVLTNVQGQIDHALDLYQDIKDNNMKPLTVTLDPVTNANGSYTHITEDSRITEEMKAIAFEAGTPEVFLAPVTITTADGSATLTCSNAVGTSTVTVTFVHTWPVDGGEDVPERVTSTEFDILADRIGSLSTLETTDKTSIVNAINNFKSETDTHLTEVQDGLAIISNGDTHVAIPANQYVFVKNHNSLTNGLYKAKSAIGANAALSTSNLTADPAGGLNDIKSQIDTLNGKLTPQRITATAGEHTTIIDQSIYRIGRLVMVNISVRVNAVLAETEAMVLGLPLPNSYAPIIGVGNLGGNGYQAFLSTNGSIVNAYDGFNANKVYFFNFAYSTLYDT